MKKDIMFYYMELVEFLGIVLGPSYEIVLYDLRRDKKSIIAISNAHLSGRTIDTPLSQSEINNLLNSVDNEVSYKANYSKTGQHNKLFRASTLYIRNEKEDLIGLLCINFDGTNFKSLASQLMSLVHPNELIPADFFQRMDDIKLNLPTESSMESENLGDTIEEITQDVLNNVLKNEVPLDRLTRKERIEIVEELNNRGIFMLKGSVQHVAQLLHSSEATIYRYLNKINSEEE